jgi:hypothetical protein
MARGIPKVHLTRTGASKVRNPDVDDIARKMGKKLAQVLKEDGGSSETKVY